MNVRVMFLVAAGYYRKGEVAGFPPEEAKSLAARGLVSILKPKTKPSEKESVE